jgi:hypothetical protein
MGVRTTQDAGIALRKSRHVVREGSDQLTVEAAHSPG